MCGIAGVLNLNGRPADARLLRAMTDSLTHRGPDGAGAWVSGPVALGHRRLAIIDLATGSQPMGNEEGTVWLTYNGELYNFRELRVELEARGFTFRTNSDTEVLLRAYEAFGVECLLRLRGMFAFAIWDDRRRRLFLARDRVGIKPLVYAADGQRVLFASEIKGILQDPTVSRELDWVAVRDYLAHSYIPSPRTIFRGIRKLPPGSYLVLDAGMAEPEVRRYWDLQFRPDETRSDAEWLEDLRWHLGDAVRSHLVSDVPVGAFLSGGLDSSTVVAFMAGAAEAPRTFSIGFDETEFDELPFARTVARRYRTDHCEFVVKPDALDVLPRLSRQFDEPFGDASAVPTYYVSKIAREHVTVVLSGDGGDENFAGYSRYQRAQTLHRRLDHLPGSVVRALLRLAARWWRPGARGQGYLELLGADPVERYFRMVTFHTSASLARLLTAEARAQVAPKVDPALFRRLIDVDNVSDYLSTLQYLDIRTYLPEDILTKVDRTSMLVSLESRVPLLDHILMEFLATMPTRLKYEAGHGKVILKRAMANDLPDEVLRRRKMGFGVPLGTWFRGTLADYSRDLLTGSRASQRGIFDPVAVAALLDAHATGHDRSSQIWSLLCFEEWARQWLDRS